MPLQHSKAALDATRFLATVHPQLRFSQWRFLVIVAENPGRTQSEIAKLMDLTLASVSRSVDVFGPKGRKDRAGEGRGFVRVERDADDERNLLLFLTPAGESFLEQIEAHLYTNT